MNYAAELFRLLGDAARLRMLRLLSREKLNVSELTGILGMAQSGISRHLRLLKEGGLLTESREAGWNYYQVAPENFTEGLRALWPLLESQLQSPSSDHREDDARLEEVLRQRQEDFRETSKRGAIYPGRSWAAWARTVSFLVPHYSVADLGCGEGYLTLEVARWAREVIAIDHSREMLSRARSLANKHGIKNIRWKHGKLEKLPLKNESVQVALMAQVLHCLPDPILALQEAYRVLSPGGRLLFQELRKHEEEWVKERHGDFWLGFEEKELIRLLKSANFTEIRIEVGSKRHGDPFVILIGAGRKK
jgi:ArsR family transcriptional regulator